VPEYEKAAKILANNANPVMLGEVDCSVELELRDKFNLDGYPTMYVFRKGRQYEYYGGRRSDGLLLKNLRRILKKINLRHFK
jgi:thioredoxin-like negative regulator of GroEL